MSGVFGRVVVWFAKGFGLTAASGLAIPAAYNDGASAAQVPVIAKQTIVAELNATGFARPQRERLKPLAALAPVEVTTAKPVAEFVWPPFVVPQAAPAIVWPPFIAPAQIPAAEGVEPTNPLANAAPADTAEFKRSARSANNMLAGQLAYVQKVNVPTSRKMDGRKSPTAVNRPKQRDADASAKRSPARKLVWLAAKVTAKKAGGANVIDIDSRRRPSLGARATRTTRIAA